MLPITKKRVRLSIDEKLWILNHGKENPKITQSKIPLDFSAEFKNSVPHTVCGIPQFFSRNPPSQNSDILVRAKRVLLFWEMPLFGVSLL